MKVYSCPLNEKNSSLAKMYPSLIKASKSYETQRRAMEYRQTSQYRQHDAVSSLRDAMGSTLSIVPPPPPIDPIKHLRSMSEVERNYVSRIQEFNPDYFDRDERFSLNDQIWTPSYIKRRIDWLANQPHSKETHNAIQKGWTKAEEVFTTCTNEVAKLTQRLGFDVDAS